MSRPGNPSSNVVLLLSFFLLLMFSASLLVAKPLPYRDGTVVWHGPDQMEKALKDAAGGSPRTKIHTLGKSPAASDLLLLEIAPTGSKPAEHNPPGGAILVVGNPSGTAPLGTEGALALARHLLKEGTGPGNVRWYILPCANPDGAGRFFQEPLAGSGRNASPVDDDTDGFFGEDGCEDLDGDGLISKMLLADEEGRWILTDDETPLARLANPARGEVGLYRLLSEGFDNDGDGLWNEDAAGGVVCDRNFPHRFEHWTTTGGLWPGDQPESRAILDFAFSHPEIAMVLVLDSHDTLLNFPGKKDNDRAGEAEEKVQFQAYMAEMLGVSPGMDFQISEAVEMLQSITGDTSMDATKARQYLGGDARTEPHPQDLSWWLQISEDYRRAVYDTTAAGKPADETKIGPGSLIEWAYFQFGVPAFAISFWNLPAPVQAPADSTAAAETKPEADPIDAALLGFMAANPDLTADNIWPGLSPWKPAKLPDGRDVFVGGEAPFSRTTPPPALVDSLLAARIPFLASLAGRLPTLGIEKISLTPRGSGVFELTALISNGGPLDYPTGQGALSQRVPPVIVTLEGGKLLEGRARTKVDRLPANQTVPVRWLVHAPPGTRFEITAEAPSLGRSARSITASAKGGQR